MSGSQEHFFRVSLSEVLPSFVKHDKDCGSSCVQIINLTEAIINNTSHMKLHPKDDSTKRGLLQKVNRRKKLLAYLGRVNPNLLIKLKETLGLR